MFCFEKCSLLAYLNEDKELAESRKCGEGTRDVVSREKITKEKQIILNILELRVP